MPPASVRALAALALALALAACAAATPRARHETALLAVSCPSASLCVAVGQQAHGTSLAPLSERLAGGSWRTIRAPGLGRSSQLLGVSCAGSRFCMAVGAEPTGALSELWNGQRWQRVEVSGPVGVATLTSVSCVTQSFCLAVGATSFSQPLIELWDGTVWSRLDQASAPNLEASPLESVSCASATFCVAVGTGFEPGGGQSTLIERYADGGFESLPPIPSLTTPSLESVSCVKAGCLAVGSQGIGPQRKALALTITTTSVQRALPPPTPAVTLSAVSCAGPTTCTAIGLRGTRSPFAIRLANRSWVALQAPSGLDPVGGISCSSALDCEAVGSRSRRQAQTGLATAAALRDGSGWAAEPIPAPSH
jgi:hypothetical protein